VRGRPVVGSRCHCPSGNCQPARLMARRSASIAASASTSATVRSLTSAMVWVAGSGSQIKASVAVPGPLRENMSGCHGFATRVWLDSRQVGRVRGGCDCDLSVTGKVEPGVGQVPPVHNRVAQLQHPCKPAGWIAFCVLSEQRCGFLTSIVLSLRRSFRQLGETKKGGTGCSEVMPEAPEHQSLQRKDNREWSRTRVRNPPLPYVYI
jgi:hypothetical protein